MNQPLHHTNHDLIKHIYNDLVCKKIEQSGIDFTDMERWFHTIHSLSPIEALVYRIFVFNWQVNNGGLFQYFDNRYGIFAIDTLIDLDLIKSYQRHKILKEALFVINPNNIIGDKFINLISNRLYDIDIVRIPFSELDEKYDLIEDIEDLELLVSNYIRQNIASHK